MRALPAVGAEMADTAILTDLLSKVFLDPKGLSVSLDLRSLLPNGDLSREILTISQQFPITIKRRGIEMRLVIPKNISEPARYDHNLIRTAAKARAWYDQWQSGTMGGLRDIATRENISKSYAGDVMKLAFLSPKIVEAIAAGRQPAHLVTDHLLKADLPLDWISQERLFGF